MLCSYPERGMKKRHKVSNFMASNHKLVGAARFELTTSSTPRKRATKLRHAPTTVIILLDILHKVNPYF